jgi:uncharacterized protein (DUF1778 family)
MDLGRISVAIAESVVKRMERVEARIRPDQKERIERAAHLRGLSVSDFIVQNAYEAAIETIQQHRRLVLQGEAAAAFVKLLEKPPAPGKRLKKAFRQYRDEAAKRAVPSE